MIDHWPQWFLVFVIIARIVTLLVQLGAGRRKYDVSLYLMLWTTVGLAFVLWIGGFFHSIGVN